MDIIEATLTIPSGQSTSDSIQLSRNYVVGLILPETLDGSVVTILGSSDNETFRDVYESTGIEVEIKSTLGKLLVIEPIYSVAYAYVKFRAGTGESPVVQDTAQEIKVIIGTGTLS